MIRPSKVAVFKRSCHSQCITVSSYSIPYSVFLNWRDAPSNLSLFQRLNVTQTLSSQPRPLGPSPSHQLFTTRSRSFKHSLPLLHSETSPNHNSRMKILHESDLPCLQQTSSHGKEVAEVKLDTVNISKECRHRHEKAEKSLYAQPYALDSVNE